MPRDPADAHPAARRVAALADLEPAGNSTKGNPMSVVAGPPRPYEAMHDAAEVRTALGELHRMRHLVGQFTDVAAELPGVELAHLAAARATTSAVVSLLIERAEARLRQLTARQAAPEVAVRDPQSGGLARHGAAGPAVSVLPMVTQPAVATRGLCSAVLTVAPGQASEPLAYPDADAVLVVLFGGLEVVWLDAAGSAHRVAHRRHQHAHIRRGTPHRLVNPGAVPATALLVRTGTELTAGVQRRPELAAQLPANLAPTPAEEPPRPRADLACDLPTTDLSTRVRLPEPQG
jgi:hypothetical protein